MGTELQEIPFLAVLQTYLAWTVLFVFGHVRDWLSAWFWGNAHQGKTAPGYAAIRQDYEDFYTRRAYYRVISCFSRPVAGPPDRVMKVMTFGKQRSPVEAPRLTQQVRSCINLGSYNYLGFASQDDECTPRCHETLTQIGATLCAPRVSGGTCPAHLALEREVAAFLHKEAAVVYGMGYATNSAVLPVLFGRGDLLVSDALNHNSIVAGVRGSGAAVRVFKHNDAAHLDAVLRAAIAAGQPRTHRPWKRVCVVVEGIYSMEGDICALREIVDVKKKYGVYLYLDEAHSIGALGRSGRGACEHVGVSFSDVDILMGTFTKAFGSCGGYIASSRAVVQYLRTHSPAHQSATGMSPLAAEQALAALQVIQHTERGAAKLSLLRDNSNYFRARLLDLGFHVLGDNDSPVMPIMLCLPTAAYVFSSRCFERHLAVVIVGFPATSLTSARCRVCISAAHRRTDLDYALKVLADVGRESGCLYRRPLFREGVWLGLWDAWRGGRGKGTEDGTRVEGRGERRKGRGKLGEVLGEKLGEQLEGMKASGQHAHLIS